MKKIIGLTLFAVFMFCAVTATAALAEGVSLWLFNGVAVTTPKSVETKWELTFTDLKTPVVGEAAVKCAGVFDGTINAEGKDETTEVLNTAGEKISATPLSGLALLCTDVKNCEGTSEVWPIGLPWKTKLESPGETEEAVDDTTSSSKLGYEVSCTVLGIKETDECTQSLTAPQLEGPSEPGPLMVFKEENAASCTLSKENSGDVSGEGLMTDAEGKEIAYRICFPWLIDANYESPEKCELGIDPGSYLAGYLGIFG
jgi:hypothetical protein